MDKINFYKSVNGKAKHQGSLRIVKGELAWSKDATGEAKEIVGSLETENDPKTSPSKYLEEITMYVRSAYFWAAAA